MRITQIEPHVFPSSNESEDNARSAVLQNYPSRKISAIFLRTKEEREDSTRKKCHNLLKGDEYRCQESCFKPIEYQVMNKDIRR